MPTISEDSDVRSPRVERLETAGELGVGGLGGSGGGRSDSSSGDAVDAVIRQELTEAVFAQVADVFSRQIDNALTVIRGGIEVFARHEELPETERSLARGLVSNTDRAFELSRRLHEVAANRHLSPEPADLAQALARIVAETRSSAPSGVRVAYRPSPGEWRTTLDVAQFRRAVRELLLNAFESFEVAPPEGDRAVVVHLEPPGDGWLAFEIEDNGPGMEPGVREQCLEPFFSLRSPGTLPVRGLGLTLAHGFFRATGGDLQIDSRPGVGTRIRCTLPHQRWHWDCH